MMRVAVLIPSLNPGNCLISLVENLINTGFKDIIIVNDGSKAEYKPIFDQVNQLSECHVITHAVNLGKGRALKTGMNYFLIHYSDYLGIITVDADGQHTVADTLKVAQRLKTFPNSLVLGVRDFNRKGIPVKNKLGNKITRFIFKALINLEIQDTQTGLRGIPTAFMPHLLKLSGECFEYETNILLETKKETISISEVVIETVYLKDNASSHFNPLIDSMKIYSLIFKFTSVSFASFFIDLSLFYILYRFMASAKLPYTLFLSTLTARLLSSLFNYVCNKTFVFKSTERGTLVKYYFLCVMQVLLSGMLLEMIVRFTKGNATLLKIGIDFMLYLLSFQLQRDYIFSKHEVK